MNAQIKKKHTPSAVGMRKNGMELLAVASRPALASQAAATDVSGGALRTPESALHALLTVIGPRPFPTSANPAPAFH